MCVQDQVTFGVLFDAEGYERGLGGAGKNGAIRGKAGAVAGAGKASGGLLDRAAQVGAGQAEGGEAVIIMDYDGRYLQAQGARAGRIVACRAEIEFGLQRGLGGVTEKAPQRTHPQQPANGQENPGAYFKEIAAG